MRAIVSRLRDLSIKYKLFLSYSALTSFLIGLLLAANALMTTRESERQALRSARQVFEQTRAYLEFKMESAGSLLYLLATSGTVQTLLERDAQYYHEDIGRWPIDLQALDQVALPTSVASFVSGVRFYMKYGLASVFQNDEILRLETAEREPWFAQLVAERRGVHWFASEADKGRVLAVRSVFSRQDFTELIGIIRLDVPTSALEAILANALVTDGAAAALVTADGRLVCPTGAFAPGAGAVLEEAAARAGRARTDPSWRTARVGGKRLLVGTQAIRGSDWALLLQVPYDDIMRMTVGARRQVILVSLLMIPLALGLTLLAAGSATRRIESLIAKTKRVVAGDFAVELEPEPVNKDEIGQLTRSFNRMVSEVERLMQEKYALGQEVKSLELKALQAQINPHFLHNTLDLINWMSVRADAPRISSLVNALSRFYKLSLSRGDTICVRDELEHVRAYFQIQNMRYGEELRLAIDVPEELQGMPMLKLVLQPLVENAIFHGIMATDRETGTVRISGELRDGDLCLRVADDGAGMSEERLREVVSGELASQDHHGYGVRNIHERLILSYGPGAGLEFESAAGAGTTVTVRIPARGEQARSADAPTGAGGRADP
jgi:two-component system sensor histidine kinase YesM